MKVLLFTVHRTLNYGSVLQTYASKMIFHRVGINMTVADYVRPTDYNSESVSSLCNYTKKRLRIRKTDSPIAWLRCIVASVVSYPYTKKFWNNCNSFLSKNVDLTESVTDMESLRSLASQYDMICSGSDQIWNSDYNGGTDEVYLLAFAPEKSVRFSFASSIGKDDLSSDDKIRFVKNLAMYKGISVRERRAKELLNQINVKAKQVLDPTLWLDKEFWKKQAASRIVQEPYILLYKLKADNTIDIIAEKVSDCIGIKIVRVCFSSVNIKRSGRNEYIMLPKVEEFLSLIQYAEFVVTNSYHGTCFSINYNKQFITVARERFNSRIESILDLLELRNRLFYTAESFNFESCNKIDYEMVNNKLQLQREEDYRWLTEVTDLHTGGRG